MSASVLRRAWAPAMITVVSTVPMGFAINFLTSDTTKWWWWLVLGIGVIAGIVGAVWTVLAQKERSGKVAPTGLGGGGGQTASGSGTNIMINADNSSAAAYHMGEVHIGANAQGQETQRVLTDDAGDRRLHDGAAPNISINASEGGVAVYRADQLIIDSLAELRAGTTVLPLDALVVEPTPFVGRESELMRIADLLSGSDDSSSSSIVVVSGPPGVGKTALVRQGAAAAAAAGRFDHVLFVDLRGYADDPAVRVQPAVVLSKLLILLGVEDDEIGGDPAEQAIQYQQRLHDLAAEGKSVLREIVKTCGSGCFRRPPFRCARHRLTAVAVA